MNDPVMSPGCLYEIPNSFIGLSFIQYNCDSNYPFKLCVAVYLLDPNSSDGPMNLTMEIRDLLRKMNNQQKNEKLSVVQLSVCKNVEVESLSMCIAFSYEFLCNYEKADFFKTFVNTRSHLYSCLQVRMKKICTPKHHGHHLIYFQNNQITEFIKEQEENKDMLIASTDI